MKVEIGSPITNPFQDLGELFPTQIRNGKILEDISNFFIDLHNVDIVEVGIGNGRLAAQIADQFELNSYWLVDLSEVLDLTQRTLKPFI